MRILHFRHFDGFRARATLNKTCDWACQVFQHELKTKSEYTKTPPPQSEIVQLEGTTFWQLCIDAWQVPTWLEVGPMSQLNCYHSEGRKPVTQHTTTLLFFTYLLSLFYSFIHSFVRSFVHSFIQLFTYFFLFYIYIYLIICAYRIISTIKKMNTCVCVYTVYRFIYAGHVHFCTVRMCCLVEGTKFGSGRFLTWFEMDFRLAVRG